VKGGPTRDKVRNLFRALLSGVVRAAYDRASALNLPKESVDIYAFGKKGAEFFDRRGYGKAGRFENVSDDIVISDLAKVSNDIAESFNAKNYDRVDVVYTNFKSTFEQEAVSRTILPISLETLDEIVGGIIPEKGKFAEKSRNG
jgi:F-type H+-transporting ATPase subunit gamma